MGRAQEQGAKSLVCGILFRIPGRPVMARARAGFRAVATGPLDSEPKGSLAQVPNMNIIYMASASPFISVV